MKDTEKLASGAPRPAWTRPDDYLAAMAVKRGFRRARSDKPRTQPDSPRMLLSTLPFLVLIGFLAVIAVAIMVTAFPGNQPQHRPQQASAPEQGVAERGWFQEAQKDMHR